MKDPAPKSPSGLARKIGLHTTPKGDQVFLREDGSFSVKLKTGEIIHYDKNENVISPGKEGSTEWPPAVIGAVNQPKTPEQITLEERTRTTLIEMVRLQEFAKEAFYNRDLISAQKLYEESGDLYINSDIEFKDFLSRKNEIQGDFPVDILNLHDKYSDMSLDLERKLKTLKELDDEERELLAQLDAIEAQERAARLAPPLLTPAQPPRRDDNVRRLTVPPVPVKEAIKAPETDTFSTEFIKKIVKELLASKKIEGGENKEDPVKVKEVKNFNIEGKRGEIILAVEISADIKIPGKDKPVNKNVGLKATLGSNNGVILVKDYNADAKAMILNPILNPILNHEIKPYLEKISETIKNFIEEKDEKKRKVATMEIANGELKVTYK